MKMPPHYITKTWTWIGRGFSGRWWEPAEFEIPVAYDQIVKVKLYWPSKIQFPPNTELKRQRDAAEIEDR